MIIELVGISDIQKPYHGSDLSIVKINVSTFMIIAKDAVSVKLKKMNELSLSENPNR